MDEISQEDEAKIASHQARLIESGDLLLSVQARYGSEVRKHTKDAYERLLDAH